MRFDQEGRRAAAQFLNGLAVAFLSTLVLAPLAGGSLDASQAIGAVAAAALLNAAALMISAR